MSRSEYEQWKWEEEELDKAELDKDSPDISNKKNNLANYFFTTAIITTISALLADTLLTLGREFITLFNAATNSSYELAAIIPQELYYTLGIISLAVSPILILYELKEMYENYQDKNSKRKHALSLVKIFLLTCTALIAIQEISALSLPTIFASSIPIAGVIFGALMLLYQVGETGYNTKSKTKKVLCLIAGACLLAVATLAIMGSLTTGAAIGILIGAAIYKIMSKSLKLPKFFSMFFSMLNKDTQQTNVTNDSLKKDSPTQDNSQIVEYASDNKNELDQIHEQISSLQNTIARQQVTINASKNEINDLKQEINDLKQEITNLTQEAKHSSTLADTSEPKGSTTPTM